MGKLLVYDENSLEGTQRQQTKAIDLGNPNL